VSKDRSKGSELSRSRVKSRIVSKGSELSKNRVKSRIIRNDVVDAE
jgi:hypothetical protein